MTEPSLSTRISRVEDILAAVREFNDVIHMAATSLDDREKRGAIQVVADEVRNRLDTVRDMLDAVREDLQ